MKKILLYLLPLLSNIFLYPLCLLKSQAAPVIGLFLNIFLIPIYLVMLSIKLSKEQQGMTWYVIQYVIMLVISAMGIGINFINWWISGGNISSVGIDTETKMMVSTELQVALFIITLSWVIYVAIKHIKRKKR